MVQRPMGVWGVGTNEVKLMATPPPAWKPDWWPYASDLASALRGTADPITFVLGAGASLSSGAPPTAEVEETLRAAATRIPASDLRKRIHEISDGDVRKALDPLFSQLVPHIGYRCLATLARRRRVLVINLNWDPLVAMACDLARVPVVTYDIGDHDRRGDSLRLPPNRGVIDVHLHGRTAGRPRFGQAETLGLRSDEIDHLRTLHGSARRVYLGVSLEEDHDVVHALRDLDDGKVGTVWPFFRGPDLSDPGEVTRMSGRLGAVGAVYCQAEDVDFDHILLALLEGTGGIHWETVRQQNSHLLLPELAQLVLPRPDLIRPALGSVVSVLVGDPQLGKTTAAWMLAALGVTWRGTGGQLRAFDGAGQAKVSLTYPAGADPNDVFVIENPFGQYPDSSPNPKFAEDLVNWASTPGVPSAAVTVRTADWERASQGVDTSSRYVADPSPAEWYDLADLRTFAKRSSGSGADLAGEVREEALDTPGRILDRARGLQVTPAAPGSGRIEAVERERERLLDDNPRLASLCCLARLQAFAGEPLDVEVLRALARFDGNTPGAALMLHRYRMDDRSRVRLALPVDSAATDRWMFAHRADVEALLADPACPDGLRGAHETWSLLSAARASDWSAVRAASPGVVAENAGQLLVARPTSAGIELVSAAGLDEWTASDVAYSLVLLWDDLPTQRRRLLERLIADASALGTYAVLEACLYFQRAAAPAIWDAARNGLWALGERSAVWEMALAIDGLAWRPAPDAEWPARWIAQQLSDHPELLGVLPVLAAYHPGGAAGLGLGDRINVSRFNPPTAAQASITARLVAWHFLHQSHARAQLGHQRIVEKEYLCRTLHPPVGEADDDAVMSLLSVLRNNGEPGWAVHAACFLMGALNRPLGSLCRANALDSLAEASPRDVGVVTAAATYEVASDSEFVAAAQSYFGRQQSRDLLLDALGGELRIGGQHVAPPKFYFAVRAGRVLKSFGIRFPLLEEFLGAWPEPAELAPQVRALARKHFRSGALSLVAATRLSNLVERGDLRALEDGLAASGAPTVDLDWLVLQAGQLVERFGTP